MQIATKASFSDQIQYWIIAPKHDGPFLLLLRQQDPKAALNKGKQGVLKKTLLGFTKLNPCTTLFSSLQAIVKFLSAAVKRDSKNKSNFFTVSRQLFFKTKP